MTRALIDQWIASYPTPPAGVTLDLDDACDVVHGRQHGDMHGENILVAAGAQVMIIDFGDVGVSAASYDSVTLELSAVLQQNDLMSPVWPNDAACRQCHNLDAYVVDCPIPKFIRWCRSWAESVAAGRR